MRNHTDPHGLCTLMWIVFCFFFLHFNGGDEDTQLPAIWCHEDSLKPRDKKDSDEFTLQIWIAICCELELTLCESLWAARIDAVVLGGCTTMLSLRFWCGCSARTSFSSTQPTGNAGSAQRACWRERERARLCKGYFCFVSLGFSWKADTSGNSMSTAWFW
jgi:hypothetical protein